MTGAEEAGAEVAVEGVAAGVDPEVAAGVDPEVDAGAEVAAGIVDAETAAGVGVEVLILPAAIVRFLPIHVDKHYRSSTALFVDCDSDFS